MQEPRKTPKTPPGLQAAGRAWWRAIMAEFDLHAAERLQLEVLCQTVDDRDRLRAELAHCELIVGGHSGQPRAYPLIDKIAMLDKVIDQYVVALGLPIAGESQGRRRSPLAKLAAESKQKSQKRPAGRLGSVDHIQRRDAVDG